MAITVIIIGAIEFIICIGIFKHEIHKYIKFSMNYCTLDDLENIDKSRIIYLWIYLFSGILLLFWAAKPF